MFCIPSSTPNRCPTPLERPERNAARLGLYVRWAHRLERALGLWGDDARVLRVDVTDCVQCEDMTAEQLGWLITRLMKIKSVQQRPVGVRPRLLLPAVQCKEFDYGS